MGHLINSLSRSRWCCRGGERRRNGSRGTEAAPKVQRDKPAKNDEDLTADEKHEPLERGIHKAIRVQADAEHVDAEPGETRDDVSEDSHIGDAAVTDHPAPTGMENNCVPEHYEKRAVFFRVPAPEPTPGLVSPD